MKCQGTLKGFIAFATVLFCASVGWSTVLLNEPFSYPDGVLDAATGTKWSRLSGTANDLLVSGGKALVHDASSDDDAATLLSSVTSGSIYASFQLIGDAADRTTSTAGAESFGGFYSNSGSFIGRVLPAIPGGTPSGAYRLGIANGGTGSANVILGTDLTLGTVYTIVIRFDFTAGKTTLWVNPSTESDPNITTSDTLTAASINRFALRQPSADTMGDFSVDNLLVATTFAEVVPEPASIGLVAAVGTLLLSRRRAL